MLYLGHGAGKLCGRTPLIKLSPKKTWEGFVGGALGTMAASLALSYAFAQFQVRLSASHQTFASGSVLCCAVSQQGTPVWLCGGWCPGRKA